MSKDIFCTKICCRGFFFFSCQSTSKFLSVCRCTFRACSFMKQCLHHVYISNQKIKNHLVNKPLLEAGYVCGCDIVQEIYKLIFGWEVKLWGQMWIFWDNISTKRRFIYLTSPQLIFVSCIVRKLCWLSCAVYFLEQHLKSAFQCHYPQTLHNSSFFFHIK